MIRVHLLGRFTILTATGEVTLPTAKVRLLAAYLFWRQGRWVRRELLREMLWGDLDAERAAGNLRTALYSLRQALKTAGLPEGLLEVRRTVVRVPAGTECWIDVRAFEEKARTGLQPEETATEPLMTAASLYHGAFLEELDADWCLIERQRLADLHLAVLRALVERLTALGLHQAALSYAHRWLAADPLDEAAHRALMRLYAAMGQPAQVVEQFAQCRRILETELGVAPSEETVRLYREMSSAGDRRTAGRKRRVKRPRPVEQLSKDPLRNARMLLAYGEAVALQGESEEGIAALEKALKVYERLGSTAVKARLVLGEALLWLSIPLTPRVDQTLRLRALHYIEQALERYPVNGPPADLVRALQLGSQINWLVGRNNRAVELAKEGMALAHALGDRESETRLAVLLAMALREGYRLREADAAFEKALRGVPCLTNLWEVLWLLMQRGILAYIAGDLAEAESFLREALSLGRMAPFPSLMLKVGDTMTRSMLIVILHYRDKRAEMKELLPPPEAEKFNPEPYTYLNPLFTATDRQAILPALDSWLRARLQRLPSPMVACTLRCVTEEMLAGGLFREASRWAAAGIRLARARRWGGFGALFYCHRAVALARLGQVAPAEICRHRAALVANPDERWTPAWLARADGLIARAQGDTVAAERHLAKARHLFRQIGSRYDARQVEAEMRGQTESTTAETGST